MAADTTGPISPVAAQPAKEKPARLRTAHWVLIGYAPSLLLLLAALWVLIRAALSTLHKTAVAKASGGACAGVACVKGVPVVDVLLMIYGLFVAVLILKVIVFPERADEPVNLVRMTRAEAPALFTLLDRATTAFGLKPYGAIKMNGMCNAGISRHLRFLPSKASADLMLGLPIMDALTPEELSAVVAHELGHVTEDAGQSDALLRASVALYVLAGTGWLAPFNGILHNIYVWYMSRISPILAELGRRSEWAADEAAARFAGPKVAAAALIRTAVACRAEAEIQRRLFDRMRFSDHPRCKPIYWLPRWLRQLDRRAQRHEFVQAALIWQTGSDDSHPALVERLERLGVEPFLPEPISRPASRLLGAAERRLRDKVHASWVKSIESEWFETFQRCRWSARRLRELDREMLRHGLKPHELVEHAELTFQLKPAREAIVPLRRSLEVAGRWTCLRYWLATVLMERGDDEGLWLMLELSVEDCDVAAEAAAWVADHLARRGELDLAKEYVVRNHEAQQRLEAGWDERQSVSRQDTFLPHGLDQRALELVRGCLADIAGVGRAWLVQKACSHFSDQPFFVLTYQVGDSSQSAAGVHDAVLERVQHLPFLVAVVAESMLDPASPVAKMRKVDGSLVYEPAVADSKTQRTGRRSRGMAMPASAAST